MAETEVPIKDGRFTVPGTIPVDIKLGTSDPSGYGVVQKNKDSAIPTAYDGVNINWFNVFGVRKRKADKTLGDYASIPYTVSVQIPKNKRIFVFISNQIIEIKQQKTQGDLADQMYRIEADGRTTIALSAGDPPIGYGP